MAGFGNLHCVDCIGTLSFFIKASFTEFLSELIPVHCFIFFTLKFWPLLYANARISIVDYVVLIQLSAARC